MVASIIGTWLVSSLAVIGVGFWLCYLIATVGRPKPPKSRKAQPPAPQPAPEPAPLPDYIPRWTRARVLAEWKDLAAFQRELNS